MFRQGLYNTIGGIVRLGLNVLTIPLLIRLIGVDEYGLWSLVATMTGIFALAEVGVSVAATVLVARDLGRNDEAGLAQTLTISFGVILFLATLAALLVSCGSPLLISCFSSLSELQRTTARQALQISGLVVWLRIVQQLLTGIGQAYQRYGQINLLMTVQSLLGNPGMLIIAWLGGRTVALMQWQALTGTLMLAAYVCLIFLLLRQHAPVRPDWNRERWREIASYSLMTWLSSLGSALFSQADRLIVGWLLGTAPLGIYAAVTSLTAQINALSALPVHPLLPALSNLAARLGADQKAIHRQVKSALEMNTFVALSAGCVIFLLAPLIVHLLLPGTAAKSSVIILQTATVIYTLYSINATGYYLLPGLGEVKKGTAIQLLAAAVAILSITAGTMTSHSLSGAVMGNAGYLIICLMTFIGMKVIGLSPRVWIGWIKFPLACFLGVILCGLWLPWQTGWLLTAALIASAVLTGWFISVQQASLMSWYFTKQK